MLETSANMDYITNDGRLLVNVYDDKSLFAEFWMGWLFHKVGPAYEAFGKVMPRIFESGMIDHYKRKTWLVVSFCCTFCCQKFIILIFFRRKMKLLFGKPQDKSVFSGAINAEISSLKMEPFYGTFIMAGLFLGLAILAFLGELVMGGGKGR